VAEGACGAKEMGARPFSIQEFFPGDAERDPVVDAQEGAPQHSSLEGPVNALCTKKVHEIRREGWRNRIIKLGHLLGRNAWHRSGWRFSIS